MFHRVRFQLLLIFLCTLFVSTLAPNVVSACSGGTRASTIKERVDEAEIAVYGRIVEIDDSAQNAVLQVISYLDGIPGLEFILLALNSPAFQLQTRDRYTGGAALLVLIHCTTAKKSLFFLIEISTAAIISSAVEWATLPTIGFLILTRQSP
jgi:hypothetical protein